MQPSLHALQLGLSPSRATHRSGADCQLIDQIGPLPPPQTYSSWSRNSSPSRHQINSQPEKSQLDHAGCKLCSLTEIQPKERFSSSHTPFSSAGDLSVAAKFTMRLLRCAVPLLWLGVAHATFTLDEVEAQISGFLAGQNGTLSAPSGCELAVRPKSSSSSSPSQVSMAKVDD